jgi:hypothetical protein
VNPLKDIHRSAWLTPASHIFLAVLLTFALLGVNAAEPVDDSEKYALATRQSTCEIPRTREVADHDFRADSPERIGTLILASDKRADRQVAFAKNLDNRATNST